MNIIEKCNSINDEKNKINKIFSMLELSNTNTDSISESMIITKTIMDNINQLKDETGEIFDKMNDIPYFNPEEVDEFKDFYAKSTLRYLDEENNITSKMWIESCALLYKGIVTEKHQEYTRLWVETINNLFFKLDKAYNSGNIELVNETKQAILDLAWNPECRFNAKNRMRISEKKREELKSRFNKFIYSMDGFMNNLDTVQEVVQESALSEVDKYPLYVVLTYTGTGFGRLINAYTHGIYSHAAISLDADMTRLYSFNIKDNGFTVESIAGYLKENKESTMVIYTIFINKKDLVKIKTKLDYFLLNKKKTKYSILNIIGLMVNKPIQLANDMICSQFVDYILKTIDIDMTNKHSGLVTPNDLYMSLNPNIYKMYEGKVSDYDYKKMEKLKDLFIKKAKTITESMMNLSNNESSYVQAICENKEYITNLIALDEKQDILSERNKMIYEYLRPYIDIDYICEAKEFPVQFDKDGNLLIQKIKSIDYDHEFSQSHKLLKLYEGSDNVEGMKYELSKLWFLNSLLEKKIYSETDEKVKNGYHKSRARILNDFNKYSKIINKKDNSFNFTSYYNNSPFSDATIKINNSTLHHGGQLIKNISKLLLH